MGCRHEAEPFAPDEIASGAASPETGAAGWVNAPRRNRNSPICCTPVLWHNCRAATDAVGKRTLVASPRRNKRRHGQSVQLLANL